MSRLSDTTLIPCMIFCMFMYLIFCIMFMYLSCVLLHYVSCMTFNYSVAILTFVYLTLSLLCAFFWRKLNGVFRLQNARNLIYKFFYDNFNIKFFLNILVKTHVSNLMHFQDEMAHLFFLQNWSFNLKLFSKSNSTGIWTRDNSTSNTNKLQNLSNLTQNLLQGHFNFIAVFSKFGKNTYFFTFYFTLYLSKSKKKLYFV